MNEIDVKTSYSQTVVPVLGMHRSGTSMLTHMLHLLGMELGEPLQPPSFDNPKGFWENRIFQGMNIKILKRAGCDPDGLDAPEKIRVSFQTILTATFDEKNIQPIGQYVKSQFRDTHWGWKDPRTVITWPFWVYCLRQLGYNDIRPIIVVRHPLASCRSLMKRGDIQAKFCTGETEAEELIIALWLTYYELIEAWITNETLVLLQEDLVDPEKAPRELARCADYLELGTTGISPALATIDTNLVSHRYEGKESIANENVLYVYNRFEKGHTPNEINVHPLLPDSFLILIL